MILSKVNTNTGLIFQLQGEIDNIIAIIGDADLEQVLTNGNSAGSSDIDMSGNDILQVNNMDVANITGIAGKLDISGTTQFTPPSDISLTTTPFGLSVVNTSVKTYPTTTSFNALPVYFTNVELGTDQSYDTTTGFNFIFGDRRTYTKSAGTTSDIERLFFNGFQQTFTWEDLNTCKQYVSFGDNFGYRGINANGRTSSSFNAGRITLLCPSSSQQTILNLTAKDGLNIFTSGADDASYNITNSTSPSILFLGNGINNSINITNHAFIQNSSFWNSNLTGAGSSATITNMYGLRLNPPTNQTGLTITNNWGIYSGWSLSKNYFAGDVSIGTTTNDSSAKLQVDSTTQGFLPPRMTSAEANGIITPAEGLIVYVTNTGGSPFDFTTKGWWGYDGATWNQLG